MMNTLEDIRDALRKIAPEERKRLLLEELEAVGGTDEQEERGSLAEDPYARTLTMAGTVHLELANLSTEKNEHVADAIWAYKHG